MSLLTLLVLILVIFSTAIVFSYILIVCQLLSPGNNSVSDF